MAKVTLPTLGSSFGSVDLLNSAFRTIEAAFDNTLSLDGDTPNQLAADLDLNGYSILNPGPALGGDAIPTYDDVVDLISAAGSGIVIQGQQAITATASQTVFVLTTTTYTPGAKNLAVYVNGVRKFVGTDFVETSPTVFTLLVASTAGDKVVAVTNQYLGTVTPPTVPSVAWSVVTGTPETATRWPTYAEVTGKPATFAPSAHTHPFTDVTGAATDVQREVYVQASTPTAGRVGALWFY